jgi:hypothetical protein
VLVSALAVVPIRLILIGLALVVLLIWALPPVTAAGRKRMLRWSLYLATAGVILVLIRVGLVRLAAIGAGLLALLRWALPTALRWLPFWLGRRLNRTETARPGSAAGATGFRQPAEMTRAQALEILNLAEGASHREILSAYRELIKKVHPDHGGSSYLAAEVNRAKDVLLSE